jgi:hypothetical protein
VAVVIVGSFTTRQINICGSFPGPRKTDGAETLINNCGKAEIQSWHLVVEITFHKRKPST